MSIFPENMMKSSECSLESIAGDLSYFELQLHLLHWKTSSYAQHMATGELYDFIFKFKDEVVEKLMGYTGRRPTSFKVPPISDKINERQLLNEISIFASNLKEFGNKNNFHDIGNLADTLSGEVAKIMYLFTLA